MASRRPPGLVSVVVPMRDEREHLREQLDALAGQDYDGDWELVVADNGSRDGSREIAVEWARERGLGRVVATGRRGAGPAAARNAGARASEGELLAFCDADDVAAPGWLRQLVEAAAEGDLVAGGHEGARLNDPRTRGCHDLPDPHGSFLGHLPIAAGSNLGIWRDTFDALGGFDEGSATGEDVVLSWRAQEAGYRLVPAPGAVVHKRFATGLRRVAAQYFGYGRGDAWVFSRFRASGMPRRGRHEATGLWRGLLRGSVRALRSSEVERCGWVKLAALSCGRLVGSVRHRALFP
jgi:glycosyltransferase involved in cell wall biosynthesis